MKNAASILLVLLVIALGLPAQDAPAAAPPRRLEVVLTGPRPPRLPSGELPEGWDEARLARADGIFREGSRITLHRLVELVGEEGAGAELLVRCEADARFARLRALHEILGAQGGPGPALLFAAVGADAEPERLVVTRDAFSGFSFVGGEVVFRGDFGDVPDLEAEAEPGDEELPEEERDAARQARLEKRRIELRVDAIAWHLDGEKIEVADEAGRLARLREAIAARRKEAGRAYLRIHVDGDPTCVSLLPVLAAARAAAADRIRVVDDAAPMEFLRLLGFGDRGDATWLPRVVDNALKALARSQKGDGSWRAAPGSELGDLGTSALATLAFLGEFHSPSEGAFKSEVGRAWSFLRSRQRANGSVADREEGFGFAHVLATLALVETCGLTGDDEHVAAAEKAVAFLLRCRNEEGLWGLVGADPQGDLVVSAWALVTLRAAEDTGLEIPTDVREGPLAFLDRVTAENGRVGTLAAGRSPTRLAGLVDPFYGRHPASLTAVAALARSRAGKNPADDPRLAAAVARLLEAPPDDGGRLGPADLDYLYFGALLMNAVGDPAWADWHLGLDDAIQGHFRRLQGEGEGIRGLMTADPATVALLAIGLELSYRFSRNPASGR